MSVKTSHEPVKTITGFNQSCNHKRPQKTSLLRFGLVFGSFWNWEDQLQLRSKALGAKRPDQTRLSNTTQDREVCLKLLICLDSLFPLSAHAFLSSWVILDVINCQVGFATILAQNCIWKSHCRHWRHYQSSKWQSQQEASRLISIVKPPWMSASNDSKKRKHFFYSQIWTWFQPFSNAWSVIPFCSHPFFPNFLPAPMCDLNWWWAAGMF